MSVDLDRLVRDNLAAIHSEMSGQRSVASHYPPDQLSFDEEMEQIREYIHDAAEYGLAYELIVLNAQEAPFVFTARAAVMLLELGLVMGFKTTKPEDAVFGSPDR